MIVLARSCVLIVTRSPRSSQICINLTSRLAHGATLLLESDLALMQQLLLISKVRLRFLEHVIDFGEQRLGQCFWVLVLDNSDLQLQLFGGLFKFTLGAIYLLV